MKSIVSLSILALGCTAVADPDIEVDVATRTAAIEASTDGCIDPMQYGGIPDDQGDDRAGIQEAIEEASRRGGGRVCVKDGRWRGSRASVGSYNRFAALTIHAPRIELSGAGPGTVIEVVGDQGAATIYVISIDPG